MRLFPARSFLSFLQNHGMLSLTNAPQWWTIAGGSRTYVDAIALRLPGDIHLSRPVEAVRRGPSSVTVSAGARSGDSTRS